MKKSVDNLLTAEPLSDIEKKRIYANTMGKIERYRKRSVLPHIIKVAILFVVIVATVGTAATATYHWRGALARMFGRSTKPPKEEMLQFEDKSVEEGNLIVTVKQIMGDKYGCYVWVNIKNNGEKPLDEMGTPAFETVTMVTEDNEQLICSKESDFGVEDENYSLAYHINMTKAITGKMVTMTFKNIGYRDLEDSDKFTQTQKGTWKLSWKMKYKDESTTINVNKEVTSGEDSVMLESICISPISATLQLSGHKDAKKIPYVIQFMDGTLTSSKYARSYDIYGTDRTITMLFDRIRDIEDIENVTFGNLTIPVTKNENPIERVCYINKEMHVNISMTKRLYHISKWDLQQPYHDENFDAKVQVLSCTGTRKGVSMHMFNILRIEGTMTEEEMAQKDPMTYYMRSYHGYTYGFQLCEAEKEEQIDVFADIMNEDVMTLVPWIELTD